jgi:hypothetical protein
MGPLELMRCARSLFLFPLQKTVLLSRLLEEPQRLVRHSIGVLISTLAASLVPKNQWNDLLDQLLQLCRHPSESHREIAMMLFSALAENLTNTLKKHFKTVSAQDEWHRPLFMRRPLIRF